MLFLSNKCNLACRTCRASNSSTFLEEGFYYARKYNETSSIYFDQFQQRKISSQDWQGLLKISDSLKKIEFFGGEPLLNTEHHDFLEKLIERGLSKHIELFYCTNGTVKVSEERKKIWSSFRSVTLSFSMDGIGDVYEWTRWPAQWPVFQKNFQDWKQQNNSIFKTSVNVSVSLLNLYQLPQILEWIVGQMGLADYLTFVHQPDYYCIQNLPEDIKEKMAGHLQQSAFSEMKEVISFMKSQKSDPTAWASFVKWTIYKDEYRKQSFQSLQPDYYKLIESAFVLKSDTAEKSGVQKNTETKTFCPAPFVSLSLDAEGYLKPCRFSKKSDRLGRFDESYEQAWNENSIRWLRRQMIENVPAAHCEECRILEKNKAPSLRDFYLAKWSDLGEENKNKTDLNGRLQPVSMTYFDVQLSNRCRFKCRTCGSGLSSAWAEEKGEDTVVNKIIQSDSFWKNFEKLSETIQDVCFDGGEPLQMPETNEVLSRLVKTGQAGEVSLKYLTQFVDVDFQSDLYKNLWPQFKEVYFKISLDALGDRGRLIRHGVDPDLVITNIQRARSEHPEYKWQLNTTLSLLNVMIFEDFLKEVFRNGLFSWNEVQINILQNPSYYRLDVMTQKMKNQIQISWQLWITELKKDPLSFGLGMKLQNILNFILQEAESKIDRIQFEEESLKLDQIRHENTKRTLTELAALFEEEKQNRLNQEGQL